MEQRGRCSERTLIKRLTGFTANDDGRFVPGIALDPAFGEAINHDLVVLLSPCGINQTDHSGGPGLAHGRQRRSHGRSGSGQIDDHLTHMHRPGTEEIMHGSRQSLMAGDDVCRIGRDDPIPPLRHLLHQWLDSFFDLRLGRLRHKNRAVQAAAG